MSYKELFKNKKITQVGLGVLGRGVGDAEYLAQAEAQLLVTDLKSQDELAGSLQQLEQYPHIRYRLGAHASEDFAERDLVLKGAGVPLDSPFIAEARRNGVPVDMSASLFARITDIPLVGVTGTRGKSTVTHLIHAMATAGGHEVLLGGNVQGGSNLSLLSSVTPKHLGVFELDSWQCQGFGEERSLQVAGVRQGPLSPSLAVFTNFLPDHMNYYKGSMEQYLADKANIFLHQSEADTLVVGAQAYEILAPYKSRIKAHVVVADESMVPTSWKLRLQGAHNRYNIGIAVATARVLGVRTEVVRRVAESFESLPGRMEFVREISGIRVCNDTNATTPDAVSASLRALCEEGKKNIVLIAGGTDKGLNPECMVSAIRDTCKKVLLLPGTGTDRLLEVWGDTKTACVHAETLRDAVNEGWNASTSGDILLLSPGFSSFGLFKNEYDRGAQFVQLLKMF